MSTKRQLIVLGVGVVMLALVLTLAQRLLLPERSTLRSWTPTPEVVAGQDLDAAAKTCRDVLDLFGSADDGVPVAERRGGWTLVVLESPGRRRTCLMTDDVIGARFVFLRALTGGFAGGWSTPASPAPTLPADGIEALPPEQAETTSGRIRYVSGWVGDDVAEVQVSSTSGPDIDATVSDGRFVLWYPASESPGDGPDDSFLTYTLTLADGSTREHDAWLDGPDGFS